MKSVRELTEKKTQRNSKLSRAWLT